MTCKKCNKEKEEHKEFCSSCGADLTVPDGDAPCDHCSESEEQGYESCNVCGRGLLSGSASDPQTSARCGKDLEPDGSTKLTRTAKILFGLSTVAVAICVGILFFEAFISIFKLPTVMTGLEGCAYELYILTPFLFELFSIGDIGCRIIYIVELIIVLTCIVTLLYTAFRKYKETGKKESLRETGLYEVICLNGILLIFQLIYFAIIGNLGNGSGGEMEETVAESMFTLLNAAVYEEFLCRICLLGLPIAIVYLIMGKKELPFYRYLLGGFEFKRWMLVFVLLSATFFALGHYTNWGWWKIVPTFVFGLIAAYIFIKYGVYATITIHFITDFLSCESWLTGMQSSGLLTALFMLAGILAFSAIPYYFKKVRGIVGEWRSPDKGS